MAKTINVDVPLKGISTGARSTKIETTGFVGTTCQDATKFLAGLGTVLKDEATDEMYQQENIHEHLSNDGG